MDPKFLDESIIDIDKFKEYIKYDVYDEKKQTLYSRLKVLDDGQRVKLFAICFDNEDDKLNKARLVSRLMGIVSSSKDQNDPTIKMLRDDCLYYSFFTGRTGGGETSYYDSYEKLRGKLEEQRIAALKKNDYKTAELIDQILQFAIQEDLRSRHKCLHDADISLTGTDLEDLKDELDDNYELRSFDFGAVSVDEKVKAYVEFICKRNKMYDLAIKNKRGDKLNDEQLSNFIDSYKSFEGSDCGKVVTR